MNCRSFRKRMAELLDVSPDPAATADLLEHVANCPECAREYNEALGTMAALRPSHKAFASPQTKERIMDRVLELEAGRRSRRASRAGWLGRVRPAWAGVAVALVLLAAAGLRFAGTGGPPALSTLAEAAEFVKGVKTMHIVAQYAHDRTRQLRSISSSTRR